jgi:hypothetical protein
MLRSTLQLSALARPRPPLNWFDGNPSLVGSLTHLHAQWRASVGHRHTRRASARLDRWGSIVKCCAGLFSVWSCSYGSLSSRRGLCELGSSPVPDSGSSPAFHETSCPRRPFSSDAARNRVRTDLATAPPVELRHHSRWYRHHAPSCHGSR